MINLLTAGGFGDAALSFAKIHARFSDKLQDIKVTHVSTNFGYDDRLMPMVKDFYSSQNIDSDVFVIPDWNWKEQNRKDFDFYLGTSWYADNAGAEKSWEINPN